MGGVGTPRGPYAWSMSETREDKEAQVPEVPGEECELCGTEMFGLHCKLICPNCGYRRDCSDP